MADIVVKEGSFGDYASGNDGATFKANIDKLIELLTPSTIDSPKLMAEPLFSLPDEATCKLITDELKAIKAAVTG